MPRYRIGVSCIFTLMIALGVATPAWAQSDAAQNDVAEAVVAPEGVEDPPGAGQQNLAFASPSHNAELTFFVGGLVGGDLSTLLEDGFSLRSTLDNGRTYGGRVGYYAWPLGVEGSFTYSNSGLAADATIEDVKIRLGARVMYAEVNGMFLIIPGPVQPFLTGGGGLHSYELTDLPGIDLRKWGWNFGGGLKVNIKRVTVRADVRDHLTRVTAADLGIDADLADLLGIVDQDLHNVEVSFGVGIKF